MGFSSRGLSEAQIQAQADASIAKVLTNTTNLVTDARALNLDHLDSDVSAILPPLNYEIFRYFAAQTGADFAAIAGAWDRTLGATYQSGVHLHNTVPGINDHVGLGGFFVPTTGDHTIVIIAQTSGASGILSVTIDGSVACTIDMYTVANVPDVELSSTLGSLTAGAHTLSLDMLSKNGASTDYACRLQVLAIYKG